MKKSKDINEEDKRHINEKEKEAINDENENNNILIESNKI